MKPQYTARIAFRVTPAHSKKIHKLAEHFNLPLSTFLRQAATIAAALGHQSQAWHEQHAKAAKYLKDKGPWNT